MRRFVGVVLVLAAIPIAAYGLFAVLYRGDSGGDGGTYVMIGNRDVDAQLVGAVSLALAAAMIAVAWLLIRRRST
jgi:hypothetical protein